jgi:hypothetical protein
MVNVSFCTTCACRTVDRQKKKEDKDAPTFCNKCGSEKKFVEEGDLSLCHMCSCMTKDVKYKNQPEDKIFCGKCKEEKKRKITIHKADSHL